MFTQIKACLNSRPLSPLSKDPIYLIPLTPGHFLVGQLTSFAEPNLDDIKPTGLNRYQQLVQMLQHFWKRWKSEYLHQLQQRSKWTSSTNPRLNPGTMVVIQDDNLPPMRWRMGRILELHPGQDNVTRVVTVRTSEGIIKRPVKKICILPIEEKTAERIPYQQQQTVTVSEP
ncbi:uncharacterized protein LOC112904043 [Agrilus planipennis]|uniref:Uncharacterized protein LOC112904043 n=1 Tax=Agrilus planipennis TaxID=224129 RepID=A0A7F5R220_AGRPL|nr:uncharacterized protein LOC112904043 [Agrilus planipennis]